MTINGPGAVPMVTAISASTNNQERLAKHDAINKIANRGNLPVLNRWHRPAAASPGVSFFTYTKSESLCHWSSPVWGTVQHGATRFDRGQIAEPGSLKPVAKSAKRHLNYRMSVVRCFSTVEMLSGRESLARLRFQIRRLFPSRCGGGPSLACAHPDRVLPGRRLL
jgi:hypothetical protein